LTELIPSIVTAEFAYGESPLSSPQQATGYPAEELYEVLASQSDGRPADHIKHGDIINLWSCRRQIVLVRALDVFDNKIAVDLCWRVVDIHFRLNDDALLTADIWLKRHNGDEPVLAFKVRLKPSGLPEIDFRVVFDKLAAIDRKDSAGIERVWLDVRDIELIGLCDKIEST